MSHEKTSINLTHLWCEIYISFVLIVISATGIVGWMHGLVVGETLLPLM